MDVANSSVGPPRLIWFVKGSLWDTGPFSTGRDGRWLIGTNRSSLGGGGHILASVEAWRSKKENGRDGSGILLRLGRWKGIGSGYGEEKDRLYDDYVW